MDKIKTTRQFPPLQKKSGLSTPFPPLQKGNKIATPFPPLQKGGQGGFKTPASQRGIVIVFTAIAMLALLAMVGLALDMSHAYVNKTRLQNSLDAAALAAAKVLDQTGDTVQAETAALAILAQNASEAGNEELGNALGDMSVVVQFSDTLNPFVPGGASPNYVRVRANNFDLESWFIQVLGIDQKTVGASAVAGPSPTIDNACNLAPFMACGDPAAGGPFWGYEQGEVAVLKTAAQGNNWEVGPGNFQLIRLGSSGANAARDAAAGAYEGCMSTGEGAETQPGNVVSVAQGLNTRLGIYKGAMKNTQNTYPPDIIVTQHQGTITEGMSPESLTYNWADYQSELGNPAYYDYPPPPDGIGRFNRRILTVPMGNCNGTTNGQGTVDVLGFGCFFLLQEMTQQGTNAYVYGQFVDGCLAGGVPGPTPNNGPGPYIIQLYEDPDSIDS